jgi:hypothetical protein
MKISNGKWKMGCVLFTILNDLNGGAATECRPYKIIRSVSQGAAGNSYANFWIRHQD